MPTGYTAEIQDGISFENFLLSCARAFGACIMQRDDPKSDKPKLQEPSDYHKKQIDRIRLEIERIRNYNDDDWEKEVENYYMKSLESAIRHNRESAELKEKYTNMLEKVNKWTPPTSEHYGLKDFMIKQIEDSIKFDCHERELPKKPIWSSYKHDMEANLLRGLAYHIEENKKEIERTEAINKWITDLYNSISN